MPCELRIVPDRLHTRWDTIVDQYLNWEDVSPLGTPLYLSTLLGQVKGSSPVAVVQYMGKYGTARSYGEEERPSAALAAFLRPNRERTTIARLLDEDGQTLLSIELIADRFK